MRVWTDAPKGLGPCSFCLTTFSSQQYKLGGFANSGSLCRLLVCNQRVIMKKTFPKFVAVLLAISAVAFMGVSMAAYFGRPNPVAEMGAEEISDYNFQQSAGEEGGWSVTPVDGTNQPSKPFKNAYEAVAFAHTDKTSRLTNQTNQMNTLTETLRTQIQQVKAGQEEDRAAIEKRIARLNQYVADANQVLAQKSLELQKLSVETADIRRQTSKRREDVKRLQTELDELRTDRFRLEEILVVLTDRLVRLQLENQALEQRLAQ